MCSLPFGYSYDIEMLKHDCPYDSTMAENPNRMKLIYERLMEDGLLDNSIKVDARPATDSELMLNHPADLLRDLENLKTNDECEEFCRDKEILWLGPKSESAARYAAGASIDLVKANLQGKIGNGFAIVRPPGHHSYGRIPQGYCVFNNVAVAAKVAVEEMGVKKVAVVDIDIHPGNGTYYSLRDDDRFHFTSFHAYHHGSFWPFSTEFDYNTKGNQLFFPLNGTMNTEGDFISAFLHVLLPILKEWSPELIIISAGFDAGYYDIMCETGQAIKAHGYGHMVRLLNEICPGHVLAILEGGYFPANYTESASMMVRGLQDLRLPHLTLPKRISAPLRETIWNNLIHHRNRFECIQKTLDKLQAQQMDLGLPMYVPAQQLDLGKGVRHLWESIKKARAVRTRKWFPELSSEQIELNSRKIREYIEEYDYSSPMVSPSESFLLAQLIWDERSAIDSYVGSAPICLVLIKDFTDFIEGKKQSMMICDRTLYDEAKAEGRIKE